MENGVPIMYLFLNTQNNLRILFTQVLTIIIPLKFIAKKNSFLPPRYVSTERYPPEAKASIITFLQKDTFF